MRPRFLFYEDPYLREADAKVVKIDGIKVWLDQTIFFAESGGQVSDTGFINGVKVIDVDPESYAHILEEEPSFNVGDVVKLELDWDRRYRIMRLHSAAHLVYFVVKEVLNDPEVIGSHVSPEKARIDYAFEGSIGIYLRELESRVNEVIKADKEIHFEEPRPGWRVWVLGDWRIPCSGIHVKRTGEIGKVKLKRRNLGKGKERIEIYLV